MRQSVPLHWIIETFLKRFLKNCASQNSFLIISLDSSKSLERLNPRNLSTPCHNAFAYTRSVQVHSYFLRNNKYLYFYKNHQPNLWHLCIEDDTFLSTYLSILKMRVWTRIDLYLCKIFYTLLLSLSNVSFIFSRVQIPHSSLMILPYFHQHKSELRVVDNDSLTDVRKSNKC